MLPMLSIWVATGACASGPHEGEEPREEGEGGATTEVAGAESEGVGPERPSLPSELVEGEPMFTVLPVDEIPAIDDPEFASVAQAAAFMSVEEPVLGVVGADGTAKCYSAWHLEEHEIVNDSLDGAAIAATW